ncbi:AAA family ATPase [Parapedobacter sp. ISTM3]|uniref:AAA family ATPase n=1 Tax=Parapedobacter sp. ISTM3 TaxID=2800130 RepID=UPI001902D6E3|nr:AAA family ATPase [Parapedobacter sp. ISTM3]
MGKCRYPAVPEAARIIIQQQMAINGDGLPWKNKEKYTNLMLEAAIRDYKQAVENHTGSIFFDRSVFDAICYATMIGYTIDASLMKAALSCRYNKVVFMLPPWPEIYKTDKERKQSWKEAEYTYYRMKKTYHQYGYDVVDVPKGAIDKRKEFVLSHIKG